MAPVELECSGCGHVVLLCHITESLSFYFADQYLAYHTVGQEANEWAL